MKDLTIQEVKQTAFLLAQKHMSFNEPIPDLSTRNPGKLEACLAMPFMKIGGSHLYKGLTGKASILFYLMVKNHPFQNGNKRIAIMTLFLFLYVNKLWLEMDSVSLYALAIQVTTSPSREKDAILNSLTKILKKYIVIYD